MFTHIRRKKFIGVKRLIWMRTDSPEKEYFEIHFQNLPFIKTKSDLDVRYRRESTLWYERISYKIIVRGDIWHANWVGAREKSPIPIRTLNFFI